MKNTIRTLATIGLLSAGCNAIALEELGKEDPDDLMFSSFRVSYAQPDYDNLKGGFNLGGSFGFRLPDFNMLAIEINLSTTLIPGENEGGVSPPLFNDGNNGNDGGILDPLLGGGDNGDNSGSSGSNNGKFTRSNSEFASNSFGIFASLETPRSISPRFFATARIGYSYVDSTIPEMTEDGRGHGSWGLGFGYRYGNDGRIELRYTQVSDDLFLIGLGYSY